MITVNNLNYIYPGGNKPAVRDVSFAIEPGEVFGFLGPSGAGKTTTQKILIGLLKGYSGQVRVFDKEISAWGQDIYEQIGVSFELPNHYLRLTAQENLDYFASLYSGATEDPLALLELVGLAGDAGKMVGNFSKGMMMRLNFARSLLNKPRLLFMDEPTTGLDPVNAANIKRIVKEKQSQGVTIFLTTHDMTVADELCDRVAFIVDGAISLIDAPKTLKIQYGQRKVTVEYAVNGHLAPTQNKGVRLTKEEFPLDGLADNAAFLAALRDNRVETIHTQETTLENIFIQATGRELA